VADTFRFNLVAQILAGLALLAALELGLLPALLSGLLVYELVQMIGLRLRALGVGQGAGNVVALTLLVAAVTIALSVGTMKLLELVGDKSDSPVLLLNKMAEVIDTARNRLPMWLWDYLPENIDQLKVAAVDWLRQHAGQLQQIGQNFGRILVRILIGMIIGGIIAVRSGINGLAPAPLTRALSERMKLFSSAFRCVVFAQIRISALNTFLTGLYLGVVLPTMGLPLPLTKTMIAVTFVVGLLPVVGNLISNTVIVIVSLSVSPVAAFCSLLFLIAIHKLEYFVNARIVGTRIRARAWEILVAMLAMEAAFGLPGVVAAPIYYAYLKNELSSLGLI
jgi:predicted PurR-regulated permease PerM